MEGAGSLLLSVSGIVFCRISIRNLDLFKKEFEMNKSNQSITFKGNPTPVHGSQVSEGEKAPGFKLTGNDMADVQLSDYDGKVLVLLSVPSVETPVCQTETRRFNELATDLSDDIEVLAVSVDLPFAQKRWCGAEGIEAVKTASDYKYRKFQEDYGVYASDLGLLARAVFVIGKDGNVKHVEYVGEIAEEPNYDAALEAAKGALN